MRADFVSDKSSRATYVLAQCRTNLPSRTHDITTPAWRLVIYLPAANLYYVWYMLENLGLPWMHLTLILHTAGMYIGIYIR